MSLSLIRHTLVQTQVSPFLSRLAQFNPVQSSPIQFSRVQFTVDLVQTSASSFMRSSPARSSPARSVRSIPFHVVQSIITRQVLTLVTSATRIRTGKRGEEKSQRPIGFFFSSFLLHARRLGTDQLEDADVRSRPVSKILCGSE